MLDTFLLCGTREEVTARVWNYHCAGMDLPILQPVVQNEEQVEALLDVAGMYGSPSVVEPSTPEAREGEPVLVRAGAGAVGRQAGDALGEDPLGVGARYARRASAWFEIMRPFSFTASTVPVAAGGALAAIDGLFSWPLFLGALFAAVFLHIGTNVINEIYDVRKGIDRITSPRASHALLKGRLTERKAFALAAVAFTLATAIGVWLIVEGGWPVAVLGVVGLLGGLGYTAPPLQYKFRALGVPLVFLLMGPLMVGGAYYVVSGELDWALIAVSVPIGLLVAAILHGNEWRDIGEDARAGISTLSIRTGRRVAHIGYLWLVVGAYLALAIAVIVEALPTYSLAAMLSLPLLVRAIRSSELGASGQQRAIAMIDLQTAQLQCGVRFPAGGRPRRGRSDPVTVGGTGRRRAVLAAGAPQLTGPSRSRFAGHARGSGTG
jgi:1,4-dihydroxy-2-naphthoate polyprenyltransferase